MADGAAILLRELEGQLREVVIPVSALPSELTTSTELRTNVTWYPGASRSSTQVMGTKEDPITFDGELRDVWLGAVGGAESLYQHLREILLAGVWCELSWGETIVRRGFLKKLEPKWRRDADIGYRITFEVDEADDAIVMVPAPFEKPSSAELDTELADFETLLAEAEAAVDVLNLIGGIF